jgi:hypothetical protein
LLLLFSFLLVSILILPIGSFAQLATGQIEGVVLDPSGAVVPEAQVMVRHTATGMERVLTTDASGNYRAVALDPGTYSLKVEKEGFQSVEQTGVMVTVGSTTTVDIALRVAGAAETVVVTEAITAIDTEKTDVSVTVPEQLVHNVPVIGRRFDFYVLSAPTVGPDGSFGLISYRGTSGLYNNNTLDGVDNNQAFFSEARGRTRSTSTYSLAGVKEFQVTLDNFSAEYGRAAGGLVNAVTKSGTNAFHGEAFYFIRDYITNAREPTIDTAVVEAATGKDKLSERRQQFGFAMGGPVVHDKLFWFLNYEQLIRGFPYVVTTSSPAFPDSNCGTLPTVNQRATCQFFESDATVVGRRALNETALGKIDWTINPNNILTFNYNFHQWRSVNGIRTPQVNFNAETDNGFDGVRDDSLYFRLSSTISSSLLNEARFQYARDNENQRPNGPGPSTTVTGGFSYGMPNFLPRPAYPFEKRFQWMDNLSWIKGRHTFKFGVDINYVRDEQINLFQGGGVYSYPSFASLAGDCPPGAVPFGCVPDGAPSYSNYQQAFDLRVLRGELAPEQAGFIFFTTTDYNGYLQDTFRVHPDVTLTYGLRYEYQQLPQPDVGNPLFPLTQSFNQDKNNWGPRIGLAWDIGGRHNTVIRTGYGLVYGRTSNSAVSSALLDNGVNVASFFFVPATAGRPVYPQCFFPAPNSPNCTLAFPVGTGQLPDIRQFSEDYARPLVHQAQFTIEHELFKDYVLSAAYAYSGGRRLPTFRDINLPFPTAQLFINFPDLLSFDGTLLAPGGVSGPFPFYTGPRPFTGARRVLQSESVINSSYNALILRANKRMSHGILFDTHFTWSKAIDNGQISQTFFSTFTVPFDPLNLRAERSLSNFDKEHRFVANFLWRPGETWTIPEGAAGKILGGWQFSGGVVLADGNPTTVDKSGNISGATGAVDVTSLNGSGGSFRAPFFGRNPFTDTGFANVDFRVSRSISITESKRVEVIVESFNIFNRTNFVSEFTTGYGVGTSSTVGAGGNCGGVAVPAGTRCVNLNPRSPADYLSPRSASSTLSSPREFQFALKFFW